MSQLEDELAQQIEWAGLPVPEREWRFSNRRWRFDFCWPDESLTTGSRGPLALEIEGGTRTSGRHTRGQGFEDDCEKYNAAALIGWTVLRVTADMVKDGRALRYVQRAFGKEPT